MSIFTILALIDSVLIIILVGLQGKNSEEISSALLGGDKDLALFKDIKERGAELFLKRLTIFLITLLFVLLYVILAQGGTI